MRFNTKGLGISSLSALLVVVCSPSAAGETRNVRRGDNLQAVLNAASAGDVILLEAGAEFVGNFTLPVKAGPTPVVLRSAPSPLLPADGRRIQPQHASLLARLRSPNASSALKTAPGAAYWHLRYLEFGANHNGYGDIMQIGDGSSAQNSAERVPHHITLDHLYVHGDPLVGQKRCIALNAAHVTVRDSHIADCKGVGLDTQAIGGWNGPGPYVIENNYLEGAGENVMFGGADPAIPNLVADGIAVKGNLVSRPFAWRDPIIATPQQLVASAGGGGQLAAGAYTYAVVARRPVGLGTIGRSTASPPITATVADGGAVTLAWEPVANATEYRVYRNGAQVPASFWTVTASSFVDTGAPGEPGEAPTTKGTVWSVKNLFELKNARNVTIEGNIFENHWKEAQAGYSIVLTPRNSNGSCTWCVVEHVTFENNVVRNVTAGINLLGHDSPEQSGQSNNIVIRNNLFHGVQEGLFFLMGDGPRDVVLDHNTVSHGGNAFVYVYGGTSADPREVFGVRITNNAVRHNTYGINGAHFGYGNAVITAFFPGGTVTGNFLAGGAAARYPAGNLTAGSFEAEFVDAAGGDFRLRPGSRLRGAATDGGDIGADMGTLLARVSTVEGGVGSGSGSITRPMNLRVVAPQ